MIFMYPAEIIAEDISYIMQWGRRWHWKQKRLTISNSEWLRAIPLNGGSTLIKMPNRALPVSILLKAYPKAGADIKRVKCLFKFRMYQTHAQSSTKDCSKQRLLLF